MALVAISKERIMLVAELLVCGYVTLRPSKRAIKRPAQQLHCFVTRVPNIRAVTLGMCEWEILERMRASIAANGSHVLAARCTEYKET